MAFRIFEVQVKELASASAHFRERAKKLLKRSWGTYYIVKFDFLEVCKVFPWALVAGLVKIWVWLHG